MSILSTLFASKHRKLAAWQNARLVNGSDPKVIRQDDTGAMIRWNDYADRNSNWGWLIERRQSGARGRDEFRAVHCQNVAKRAGLFGGLLRFSTR